MNKNLVLSGLVAMGIAPVAGAQVYTSAGNSVAIPDLGTTSLDLVVTDTGIIADINVGLIITHTWQGDIVATLEHVGFGAPVQLINRPGGTGAAVGFSADNYGNLGTGAYFVLDDEAANIYDTPFVAAPGTTNIASSFKPDSGPSEGIGSLSPFDGQSVAGTWRLTVSDHAAADIGAIRNLQLQVTFVPGPSALALLGLAGLAGVGRRRR